MGKKVYKSDIDVLASNVYIFEQNRVYLQSVIDALDQAYKGIHDYCEGAYARELKYKLTITRNAIKEQLQWCNKLKKASEKIHTSYKNICDNVDYIDEDELYDQNNLLMQQLQALNPYEFKPGDSGYNTQKKYRESLNKSYYTNKHKIDVLYNFNRYINKIKVTEHNKYSIPFRKPARLICDGYESYRIYKKNHHHFKSKDKRVKNDVVGLRKKQKPLNYEKYARWNAKFKYDVIRQGSGWRLTFVEKLKVRGARFNYTLKESIKGDFTIKGIKSQVSDWKAASKIGKAGKALGVIGTGLTVFSDFDENILSKLNNGVDVTWRDGREFVTDTAVDLGTGYICAAFGAAVGGPFGFAAGMALGAVLQHKWNGGKSVIDYAKDGISGVCDWVGSWF